MIDELNKAVQVAQIDLQAATAQLTALEKQVGSDLPELALAAGCQLQRHVAPPHSFGNRE